MSLQYIFEGPKGAGKSTMLRLLKENNVVDEIRAFTGELDHLPTVSQLKDDASSPLRYAHDRGFLSNMVHMFLWDSVFSLPVIEVDGAVVKMKTWHPITRSHMQTSFDLTEKKIVIFYASDINVLIERIANRAIKENKGANEQEYNILKETNILYENYGRAMQALAPDKVMLLDTCSFDSIESMYEVILNG